jgi:lysyl endopeptidase
VIINWEIIGVNTGNSTWIGDLPPLQTVNIQMDPIPLTDGAQTLYIYTTSPNGVADQNTANDGSYFELIVNDPGQLITLTLNLDQLGSETRWQLHTSDEEFITQGGPYMDTDTGYTVTTDFCLGDGCYIFSITDDFGDGICCGEYGNGNYNISDQWNTYVESDGTFGEGETMLFCVIGASVDENTAGEGNIWPNPATDVVHVSMAEPFGERAGYSVVDAVGRVVTQGRLPAGASNMELDLRALTAGSYVLVLDGHDLQARYPLVLRR